MGKNEYASSENRARQHGPMGGEPAGMGGEQAKDLIGTWKKLLGYCRKYTLPLVIALVCAAVGTVLTLAGPDKLSDLTNYITEGMTSGIDMDAVTSIGMMLVGFYALSYILSALQGWIMATVTQRVSKEMRSDISRKINRLPMWFYNRTTTGDVLSRVTNDVDTIGQSLNQSIGNLLTSIILFVGSFIMMLITNVTMTATAVIASILGFAAMFAIMGRSQKYFTRQQKAPWRIERTY